MTYTIGRWCFRCDGEPFVLAGRLDVERVNNEDGSVTLRAAELEVTGHDLQNAIYKLLCEVKRNGSSLIELAEQYYGSDHGQKEQK